jgi:sec-independent protein translocase protein TatB
MPSFQDSIFLFFLALMLLGPKKLPALARELGKWVGEFRRASNEFKMQMEEEMRASEQAEKEKKIEAIASSAPSPTEPVPTPEPSYEVNPHLADSGDGYPLEPEPIATEGEVTMMPPESGLPVARGSGVESDLASEADALRPPEEVATPSHSEATHG